MTQVKDHTLVVGAGGAFVWATVKELPGVAGAKSGGGGGLCCASGGGDGGHRRLRCGDRDGRCCHGRCDDLAARRLAVHERQACALLAAAAPDTRFVQGSAAP